MRAECESGERRAESVRAGESEAGMGWGNAFQPQPPFGGPQLRPQMRARALRLRLSAVLVPSVRPSRETATDTACLTPSDTACLTRIGLGMSDSMRHACLTRGGGGSTPWR